MDDILSLLSVLHPHLSMTQLRQFSCVVFGMLAMTGRVSMRNLSRWTSKGGSYRTVQRFFNTVLPWSKLSWIFFRTYLLDTESPYILAGDETVVSKSGDSTYGVSRFFSSMSGKTIPGLAFFSLSLVSVKERRSYPLMMEQIVRDTPAPGSEDEADPSDPRSEKSAPAPARKRGRPKGSRNRNKREVEFSRTLKHIQNMLRTLLKYIDGLIPVRYLVLDGPVWTQSGTADGPPMWDVFDLKVAEQRCALFSTDRSIDGPRTSTPLWRASGPTADRSEISGFR